MKHKKGGIFIFTVVCMMFWLIPLTSSAATEYPLTVNGIQVTEDNAGDVLGDGTVSYDAVGKTLILNGATITTSERDTYPGIDCKEDLTIILQGQNKIEMGAASMSNGITAEKNLTIKGEGSLDIISPGNSIWCKDILTIDGAELTADSRTSTTDAASVEGDNGIVVRNGADVEAMASGEGAGLYVTNYNAVEEIEITDSMVTVTSDYGDGIITDDDITITNSTVKVTTGWNGIYSFVGDISISEKSTVTVDTEESGVWAKEGDVSISESEFTGTTTYPSIRADKKNVYITGGTVTASAADDYAIFAYGEAKISGGTVLDITGSKGIGAEPVSLENVKGSINIKGADQTCIYSWSDISFTDCDELSLHGDLAVNAEKDITINTSNLEIFGDEPLYADNDLTITDSQITVEAERHPIMANDGTLTFDGETTLVKATGSWFINGSKIEIKNGTIDIDVTADPKESVMAAVFANKGINISGGKVTAKVTGGEGITTRAMMSNGKIELTGGVITLEGDKVIYVSTNGGELSFGGQDWYQWTDSKLGKPVSSKDTAYVYNQEDSYVRFEPVGTKYKLNVENGEGSGDYTAGDKVEISAKLYDANGHFTGWSITGYDGDILGNVNESTTTITVPPTAVTVTANYEKHSLTHQDSKDPTCTEVGWEEYDYCTKCDYSTYKEIPATNHTAGTEWKSDGNSHWKECVTCSDEVEQATHTFEWVTDKEATGTEAGSKHQECTVCGYAKAAVEIPATGSSDDTAGGNKSDDSVSAKTGDDSNMLPMIAVMALAAAGAAGTTFYGRKKKMQ